jgi:hypothetical protein
MPFIRLIAAASAVLAAACAVALPARAAVRASCGGAGYSYAGVSSLHARYGVGAQISTVRKPAVANGHVAAWVGVGGSGLGPNNTSEWLQVGISALPGQDAALYYEVALPNHAPHYVMLQGHLPLGHVYDVAVLEAKGHSGSWIVWVNGAQMTRRIHLPGSHGAWRPVATGESWNGDAAGTCNTYAFRFGDVRVATEPGGSWEPFKGRVLADVGYRLRHESHGALLASSG